MGAGPTFTPDSTFKGSSLLGWHPLGEATWRAENGEIVGTPKSGAGGWLLMDKMQAGKDSYTDPDPYGPPVLYYYRTVRNKNAPGGAEFVPELIHNRSGAGSHILAQDLNGDGALDIAVSTNRGTFIFWGNQKKRK